METDLQLIQFLSGFLSERRFDLINKVIDNRTRYVNVLLEDIFQSQNASAVLRTCDCLGIQDLHVVENRNRYQYNPQVAMGAGKWVDIHKYNKTENNSLEAIHLLRSNGYRIITTIPGENCIPLNDFDVNKGKFTIVIGSELNGVSQQIIDNSDECITIPMYGFTDSYNLSVSTAIILYQVVDKLKNSLTNWHLTEQEKSVLRLEWIKASLKKPELLVKKYNES